VRGKLFRRQVAALDRAGYEAVTMAEVWRHWHEGGPLPRRPVVLSFDDGYASQYRTAFAALRARRWPGVLNLTVNRLGARGGLTTTQVKAMLARGWEVGAHTNTHPDLRTVDAARLEQEVAGSKATLEGALGVSVDFFCYPFGRFDATVQEAVRRAGFKAATTTRRGLAAPDDDPFALDRIIVTPNHSPRRLLRVLGATSTR
jgi:peptidoglycan/xylan/chitin deacetylase (PgdA/CDA1 family)